MGDAGEPGSGGRGGGVVLDAGEAGGGDGGGGGRLLRPHLRRLLGLAVPLPSCCPLMGLDWRTTVCRMALRGRELWTAVGKGVASGAGSFGVFMAVGSGIRC